MVCELVRAEALAVTVPLRVPLAVGENFTPMVQSLPVVNSLGLLLVSAKSRLILMPVIFRAVAPGLLSVTLAAASEEADAAIREALVGNAALAKEQAKAALALFNSTDIEDGGFCIEPGRRFRASDPTEQRSRQTLSAQYSRPVQSFAGHPRRWRIAQR
jgi:hypothetical protein